MAEQKNHNDKPLSADLPPAMAEIKSQSVEEVLAEMNRMPLFMTTLDETDGEGGENMMLEALKAIAYEGTRYEIAENFRLQGNECARAKQWTDAKEFYDKAIAALKGPQSRTDPEADAKGGQVIEVELDEEEEAKKEKIVEEACYVNRALCNLEKSKSSMSAYFNWQKHGEQHLPKNSGRAMRCKRLAVHNLSSRTAVRKRSKRGGCKRCPGNRSTVCNEQSALNNLACAAYCTIYTILINLQLHTDANNRELPLLHKRLCLNPPHQPLQCQGLLPLQHRLLSPGQAPRSQGRL